MKGEKQAAGYNAMNDKEQGAGIEKPEARSDDEIEALECFVSTPDARLTTSLPRVRNLAAYNNSSFDPGRGIVVRTVWYLLSLMLLESGWFPVSYLKCALLRMFGACVGRGVVIKPHVRIKYPWRLTIGDHCWIGQEVWMDNLVRVTLESDVCISQGAFFCTGSHDHRSPTFELRTAPIVVKHGAWIAARAIVLGGAVIEQGEVVAAGSVIGKQRSVDPHSGEHPPQL